jgi:geranylgeranyl diphosphate synthase, type II
LSIPPTIARKDAPESAESVGAGSKSKRRKTSHLKLVPETKELRERLKAECQVVAARLDKSVSLTKDQMEGVARGLLESLGLPDGYVGWTMVMLSSAFFRDGVAATPPSRRLFLLPHCLKHAEGCPADYDEFGMDCKKCGACSIADFRIKAEEMGYKVLVAEGSPVVLKIIVSGYVDAIVGVACLNVLEKAIDKLLLAGIPCMAVPLLSSDCRNTSVDEDWVRDMILTQSTEPLREKTRSYVHLMRGASNMFQQPRLNELVARTRSNESVKSSGDNRLAGIDAIAATEALAIDFLAKGGKYSRPFITLAAYDALTGGNATLGDGEQVVAAFSASVFRGALSIEMFHKASLIHDDIEDNDVFRYGTPSMHAQYGIPTAINVGDYLIGLGYRMVSREASSMGGDTAADILDCLANAHARLAEGQGAELLWRDQSDKRLSPLDALKIYALKTAPAFEAALYTGVRLAGDAKPYSDMIKQFSRNIGVAFQILNDLQDWVGDNNNKLAAAGDILGGRPTILFALALHSLQAEDQLRLLDAHSADCADSTEQRIATARSLFEKAKVFEQAHRLVDKHQQRAEELVQHLAPESLKRLLIYLLDTVLERPSTASTAIVQMPSLIQLPIAVR